MKTQAKTPASDPSVLSPDFHAAPRKTRRGSGSAGIVANPAFQQRQLNRRPHPDLTTVFAHAETSLKQTVLDG
jgi:hypothetical protein